MALLSEFRHVAAGTEAGSRMMAVMHYIGVPRILQWRGFTWQGTGPGDLGDGSPPVGSRGKAEVQYL